MCVKRELAKYNKFKVLPIHPLSVEDDVVLYDYDEGIQNIDWDTLMEVGREDTYAKHVKMAECLTHLRIGIECFYCIYVKDNSTKKIVEEKLKSVSTNTNIPNVYVQKCWFI
jgi:hypothetical protein